MIFAEQSCPQSGSITNGSATIEHHSGETRITFMCNENLRLSNGLENQTIQCIPHNLEDEVSVCTGIVLFLNIIVV